MHKTYIDLVVSNNVQKAYETSLLAIKTEEPHHLFNHAMICEELGKLNEAADSMTKVKTKMPDCPVIRRLLAEYLFKLGHFREAFSEYRYRFKPPLNTSPNPKALNPAWMTCSIRTRQKYPYPDWNGKDNLNHKTICVFNDAGAGDAIQFARYLPKLKSLGPRIILEVKPELIKLFKHFEGYDELITEGHSCCDYAMSLVDLPHYLDPDLTNIPDIHLKLPADYEIEKKGFKIGIAWAGNHLHGFDKYRSTMLKDWKAISIPGVNLISLQKGEMIRSWGNLLDGVEFSYEKIDNLNDFYDTAQVINQLDLIITVDTSVAHLAGTLKKPVWIVHNKNHEWRWAVNWYDTARHFYCSELNDWGKLFEQISLELKKIVQDHYYKASIK